MVDLHRNSKADTVYFADTAVSPIGTDLSQRLTNLVTAATYASEAASGRTALSVPREIVVRLELAEGDTGVILNHGDDANTDHTYRITMSLDFLFFAQNGVVVEVIAPPGLAAAPKDYVIAWSTRDGPGVQVTSEFWVYNETDSVISVMTVEHNPSSTSAGWRFNVSGYGLGNSTFSGGLAAYKGVRIGRRYHTMVEAAEDWIAESVPPAPPADAETRVQGYPSPLARAAVGQFGGPTYLEGARSVFHNRRRPVSPLGNLHYLGAELVTNELLPDRWRRRPPGVDVDGVWNFSIRWMLIAPVPSSVNWARARVHVQQYNSIGGASVECQLRLYSMNQLPNGVGKLDDEALVYSYTEGMIDAEHGGAGNGEWVSLGDLRLRSNSAGYTYLVLAYAVDGGTPGPDADATRLRFRALTIEPYATPADGLEIIEPP